MTLSPRRRSGRRTLPPSRFADKDEEKDHTNSSTNTTADRDGKPLPPLSSSLLPFKSLISPRLLPPHSMEKQVSTVSSCTTVEAFSSSSSSSCDSETEGEADDDDEEEEKEEEMVEEQRKERKEEGMVEEKQQHQDPTWPAQGAAGGAGTLHEATTTPPCPPCIDEKYILSSLFTAARTGDTATLHDLLHSPSSLPSSSSSFLDTPHPSTGETALEVAAEEGQASVLSLLLQEGADPMRKNEQTGGTPMGKAFSGLHLECYRLLEVRRGGREGGREGAGG